MGKPIKNLSECKHPNSRKTIALVKQIKREHRREKQKLSSAIKQDLLSAKIAWFRTELLKIFESESTKICTHSHIKSMISLYLRRFDDELAQIQLKHSIGRRRDNRQHASREDSIKMTMQRERNEYETCGLEIPDFLNTANTQAIINWNADKRMIPNFKLKRFSHKMLH